MADLIALAKEYAPVVQLIASFVFGAGGGVTALNLAMKKQRRVLANLQRPVMVIGTPGEDMQSQTALLNEVGLFTVKYNCSEKAIDHLSNDHRLLVLGYGDRTQFFKVFERARAVRMPILVYAKPDSVPKEDRETISGYSFASLCNTDLRLISDVFAVMSTFPEK